MRLSVIIPIYQETTRLNITLNEIMPFLDTHFNKSFEIIIVDDPNSQNGYTELIGENKNDSRIIFMKQDKRLGKGAAVKKGCLAGRGEIILFMDADHATPVEEFKNFLPHFQNNLDILVSGVRTYQDDESKWRRVLGLTAQLFLHLVLYKKAVIDSQCGFKAFNKNLVQKIFPILKINGGMMDAEVIYLMHKYNYKITFIPVTWNNKADSKINILRCIVNDPIDIISVRLFDLLGFYKLKYPTGVSIGS